MPLERDTYHIEHSVFPLAFFEYRDRLFLVHGTEWNRLDISHPRQGELNKQTTNSALSARPTTPRTLSRLFSWRFERLTHPEWIADNGWVWHPVGIVTTWDLRQWLQENVWESEKRVLASLTLPT